MSERSQISDAKVCAAPREMGEGATALAQVATMLKPVLGQQQDVVVGPDAFGAMPASRTAHQAWQAARSAVVEYLELATTQTERLSDRVNAATRNYVAGDAQIKELYRQLLIMQEDPAAGTDALATPRAVPPPDTHPAAVRDWWAALTSEQRERLVTGSAHLVGNLDGLPAADRDRANRILLPRMLEELRADGAPPDKIDGLQRLQQRLDDPTQRPAYLLKLDATGDGQAVVAVGNPDTADRVVTHLPGMTSMLANADVHVARMDGLVDEVDARLGHPSTTAAIAYIYDSPDNLYQVTSPEYADRAVQPLHRFQEGLRASHVGEPSCNVVVPYSYGATVWGRTASTVGLDADAVALLGPIGTRADSAHSHLGTSSDKIHVITSDGDIAQRMNSAPRGLLDLDPAWTDHGRNPTDRHFGGVRLAVPGDSHEYFGNPVAMRHLVDVIVGCTR